ncbi:hypothetical protein MUCCIDRAFT_156867 [Mucor lusitanicus CBS 277.49]|uniref:BSD domain-containing protein n=1 Tax=Mucor lusitanicus CBS 277.49 TaxID=747725 RepID=A0A168I9V0_MUCCL|nr:hypothetical protein MUCCIDRAFT_156867 [Mucor lusitanicus CBS 277.49]
MYQYAASAVNSNNKEQAPAAVSEEDDVIIKAFSNIGWGKKWSSIVDTVKKQSEAFVEGTKKDLQEFSQILTEDAEEDEATTDAGTSREVTTSENEHSALDSIRESLSKINTVNFSSLRDGLTQTLNQSLPNQITSVRLPENMDLTQLKEGLANGTRSAEHYLQQFGTDVVSALKNTVTVLEPEKQAASASTATETTSRSPRIFATRKDALIAKMQTNDNTYLQEPELSKKDYDQEKKILDTFNSSFNIEEYTDEIAQLLNDYPNLRETMDRLVPVQVSYTLFWQRYFYHAWKIDQDEQKRQLIVQGAQEEEDDEADFKWDSDDEDNTTVKNESTSKEAEADTSKIRTSTSNSEDTDDFSHISEPASSTTSPPLKSSQTEDEWVKAEKKKSDDEEDSDSDWE